MKEEKKNWFNQMMKARGVRSVVSAAAGFVILFLIFSILSPSFRSGNNIQNLFRQIAPTLIIGIGQGYVLITGNIDLSIGSVVGMSCMTAGTLMCHGVNPFLACVITIVLALAIGVLNGILVARINLPSFIATLGTMTLARGLAQLVNNNHNTDFIGTTAQQFRDALYYDSFLNIYSTVWITVVLWIIFNFILSKTRTGRYIYAVGSNLDAAKLSGVNSFHTILTTYVVSALCACLTGLILLASAGMGTMDAGGTYEMYAVAACVIGGISTLGGTGILAGVIPGAGIWGILQNGLQFAGAPVALRNIIIGIIVILAVMVDIVTRTRKKGKKETK
ncbi:Ribose ABC transport system, permease protein RbsC (TC 3.A.1.2.1) [Ruminococcaceae bacterium BL-6]|jgi:ribose transport system permease protein|nr:Ribose ABC transport system, permease protein RbsC (TC 3.A.1.2.1) [Ruminococcaceae bacterium BL-6]HBC25926.1 ABC transporter permease [Oscillospiraceae bacterium]